VDADSQVGAVVVKAGEAVDEAQKFQEAINDVSGSTAKSKRSPAEDVQDLQSTVEAVQSNNLLGALTAVVRDLYAKSCG
jgi:hypothetical protein